MAGNDGFFANSMDGISANRRSLLLAGAGLPALSGTPRVASAAVSDASASQSGEISITEWGVKGSYHPGDGALIQRAMDEAPVGCTLVFPTGYYRVTKQLTLRRKLNLVARGAIISAVLEQDEDLIAVNIEDEGNRDNRSMQICGFRMWISQGGRNGIAIYNKTPNVANMGMVIENNIIGIPAISSGHAISVNGVGTHFNTIRNCQIENGILLACADGVTVEQCVVFGAKPAVTVDVVEGAFQTRVINNGLVARDGALLLLNGSQVLFSGNQVEQFAAYGPNQSKLSASVSIVSQDRGARHVRIIGNNFGGGTNVRTSILAQGDCQDLLIDENVFGTTGTGDDIVLANAGVAWSRLGPNNTVRGPARGTRVKNSVRPMIRDAGLGTFGVRRRLDPRAMNGWTALEGSYFWKDLDGRVWLEGGYQPGQTEAGTPVAILPDGFRPSSPAFLHCGTGAASETAMLRVDTDGLMRVHHTPAAKVYLGGTSFLAADRAPYPPTDP